jgi:outer membrane immunogenic protein
MKKISCLLTILITVIPTSYAEENKWDGFYAGINAGYVQSNSQYKSTTSTAGDNPFFGNGDVDFYQKYGNNSANGNNILAGVSAGYNWQSNNLIYGISSSFLSFDLSKSITNTYVPNQYVTSTYTKEIKSDWLLTIDGKLGRSINNTLIYVTGGLALSDLKLSSTFIDSGNAATGTGSSHTSTLKVGPTIGFGFEQKIDDVWSVKAEYKYAKFFNAKNSTDIGTVYSGTTYASTMLNKVDLDLNLLSISINRYF